MLFTSAEPFEKGTNSNCFLLLCVLLCIAVAGFCGGCSRHGPAQHVDVHATIKALKDPKAETRMDAAIALGSVGSKAREAVPALIEALKDPDPEVRRLAAYALGEIGPKAGQAVPALKELLKDADPKIVMQAIGSIQRIDPKSAAKAPEVLRHP